MKARIVSSLVLLLLSGGQYNALATNDISANPNVDGESALALGDYVRAQSIFQRALDNAKSPQDAGYARTAIAESLLWQGKISDAAREFKKAQPLVNANFSENSEQRARLLDDLAWLNQAQNKLDSAITNCKQAVDIRRANASANSYLLLSSLSHMGYLEQLQGQLDSAASYYQDALQVSDNSYGPLSLSSADTKEKLASLYRRLGRTEEADRLFNEAIQLKESTNAATSRFDPHPYWNNVTFRFYEGAPNCERKQFRGNDEMMLSANGVTVAVCLVTKPQNMKGTRVDLIVQNQSGHALQFLPKSPSLLVTAPKPALAPLLDPEQLASKIEKRGEMKAGWIKFWGADATTPVTTSVIGGQNFWGYPPIYAYGSTPPVVTRSGNMTTITQQVPDYAARLRAFAKAEQTIGAARDAADTVRSQTLGPTTIANGGNTRGSFFFDAQNVQKALLRIPVGNAVFEVQFPAE